MRLTDQWRVTLPSQFPSDVPLESIEQYSQVHLLETSLEQRFTNQLFWLQIRNELDYNILDDLLVECEKLQVTNVTKFVRDTLIEFAATYLSKYHQIWCARDGIESADLALVIKLTHLPPKWTIMFIFGIIADASTGIILFEYWSNPATMMRSS